jgi:2-phospho-L-lactate transferase/gluconeogenesis factor (CofD/UPF0052 family)
LVALIRHSHPRLVDCCIVNKGYIPEEILKRYKEENSFPVIPDTARIRNLGYRVVEEDIVKIGDFIRHDAEKLAEIILDLGEEF